jgi:hypothetical protein
MTARRLATALALAALACKAAPPAPPAPSPALPAVGDDAPVVTLSRTELLLGSAHIADVTPGPLGFSADVKRAGTRAALQIVPLEAALRALHDASTKRDALRIVVDPTTSYRSFLEVVFSAAHAGFTAYAVALAGQVAEPPIPASTPSRAEREAERAPGAVHAPSFVLDADGASVSVGDETIGAGCARGQAGAAVPPVSGRLDASAIGACAARVRAMNPDWAKVTAASVSAAPGLDMQAVLGVVAAILPTYPVVHFGMVSG